MRKKLANDSKEAPKANWAAKTIPQITLGKKIAGALQAREVCVP